METQLRAAVLAWLRGDPALASQINVFAEEAPVRAPAPWLGIAASASADWSHKSGRGREVRLALELHVRGDDPATGGALVSAIEARIEDLPPAQPGWRVVTAQFLRARAEQRPGNLRAMLIEYRFRLLEA